MGTPNIQQLVSGNRIHASKIAHSIVSVRDMGYERLVTSLSPRELMSLREKDIRGREDLAVVLRSYQEALARMSTLLQDALELLDEHASEVENPVLDESIQNIRSRISKWTS